MNTARHPHLTMHTSKDFESDLRRLNRVHLKVRRLFVFLAFVVGVVVGFVAGRF